MARRRVPTIMHNGVCYRLGVGGYQSRNPSKLLHRVIWQEHFGSIPRNHFVLHKNGDLADNRPENLELVSRSKFRLGSFAARPKPTCSEPECDKPARQRGLCTRHYQLLRAQERDGWQVVKRKKSHEA